jgi:Flp pilus assembly protein TadG
MCRWTRKMANGLSGAIRNESGGATVEAVLWMPFFVFLFSLVVDASLVFGGQAEILRIVQDTNRGLSLGRYADIAAAKIHIETEIAELSPGAAVTVAVADGIITSFVVIPARDLTATGIFDGFADVNILVKAQHLSEA